VIRGKYMKNPGGISGSAGNLLSRVSMAYRLVVVDSLPFQPQGINNCSVAVDVFEFYIVEQSTTSADQHQQPSAGMVIFLVNL
jgi:hypothetical protein